MKNFAVCTGMAAAVAALILLGSPFVTAADRVARVEHGHVEYAHGAGVGSVHFAPRVGPPIVTPPRVGLPIVVPPRVGPPVVGPVRPVPPVVAVPPRAVYRNPYRADYFRQFPPGYHPFVLNGAQYYGYYSLPVGYRPTILGGITYYLFGGLYYRPYMYGGQTIYVVVPAPI